MMKVKLTLIAISLAISMQAQESGSFEDNDKFGFKNKAGKIIIPAIYDESLLFIDGLSVVVLNNKKGFMNVKGQVVVPIVYDDISYFTNNGLVVAKLNGKMGFIGQKGEIKIAFNYDLANDFIDDKALVMIDKNLFFIDEKGKQLGSSYRLIRELKYPIFYVQENSLKKYGFYNDQKWVVYPNFYSGIYDFHNGLALVQNNSGANGEIKKFGYINLDGVEVILPIYDNNQPFDGKNIIVQKHPYYGVLDINGNTITPFKYDFIKGFSEGLSAVKLGDFVSGKYGYIDEQGKEVIACIYDYAATFKDDKAKVTYKNEDFYINKKGERIKN